MNCYCPYCIHTKQLLTIRYSNYCMFPVWVVQWSGASTISSPLFRTIVITPCTTKGIPPPRASSPGLQTVKQPLPELFGGLAIECAGYDSDTFLHILLCATSCTMLGMWSSSATSCSMQYSAEWLKPGEQRFSCKYWQSHVNTRWWRIALPIFCKSHWHHHYKTCTQNPYLCILHEKVACLVTYKRKNWLHCLPPHVLLVFLWLCENIHTCVGLLHFSYYCLSKCCEMDPCVNVIPGWELPLELDSAILTFRLGPHHISDKQITKHNHT